MQGGSFTLQEYSRRLKGHPHPTRRYATAAPANFSNGCPGQETTLKHFVPLELLAAGSYQLGGLPAMASALLAQVTPANRGERLYARFLRGDFDGVLRTVARFWRDHLDIADREAPIRLLNGEGEDKVAWYFTVELVRVLGALADALRRGDDPRFNRAMVKLAALDKLAVRTLNDDASMLVTLLHQVATAYGEASVYRTGAAARGL